MREEKRGKGKDSTRERSRDKEEGRRNSKESKEDGGAGKQD